MTRLALALALVTLGDVLIVFTDDPVVISELVWVCDHGRGRDCTFALVPELKVHGPLPEPFERPAPDLQHPPRRGPHDRRP